MDSNLEEIVARVIAELTSEGLTPSVNVAASVSGVTPFRNSLSRLPTHAPSPENARL